MTDLLQTVFAGLAVGSTYALVVLGFVIIYKATGVLNLAHGGLIALGAYLAHTVTASLAWAFIIAVALACLVTAAVGAGIQRVVLNRMVGQPQFAVIMITLGLLFILEPLITVIWGFRNHTFANPWGIRVVELNGVIFPVRQLWTIGLSLAVVLGFFVFFRYSRLGVVMRATAFDPEAALAHGISAQRVYTLSWAIASALAALAGIMLATGPAGLHPGIGFIALVAFPAMVLGGMDSPVGAIAGGLIVGLAETMTRAYQDQLLPWAGSNVARIVPFLIMAVILLVRPYGLFGTPEVRRL